MNSNSFLRITNDAFAPFLKELGFIMDKTSISGRFYRASFTGKNHVVSISYEPGDDALFVIIFRHYDGKLSDIDNREETPRLCDLNKRYMPFVTDEDRIKNDVVFRSINFEGKEEFRLLKSAKDLRLVLPQYILNCKDKTI